MNFALIKAVGSKTCLMLPMDMWVEPLQVKVAHFHPPFYFQFFNFQTHAHLAVSGFQNKRLVTLVVFPHLVRHHILSCLPDPVPSSLATSRDDWAACGQCHTCSVALVTNVKTDWGIFVYSSIQESSRSLRFCSLEVYLDCFSWFLGQDPVCDGLVTLSGVYPPFVHMLAPTPWPQKG